MTKRNGGTVFVVDSDSAVRDSLRIVLESYNMAVQDYDSAEAFLQDQVDPAHGCLVLDLHMPDMSAFRLLEALREKNSKLPVIVFTGRDDEDVREATGHGHVLGLFAKPIDVDALVQTIKQTPAFENS